MRIKKKREHKIANKWGCITRYNMVGLGNKSERAQYGMKIGRGLRTEAIRPRKVQKKVGWNNGQMVWAHSFSYTRVKQESNQ